MMLSVLSVVLALQIAIPADTVIDPVAVYAPVLEHVRAKHPGLPIALGEAVVNVDCPPRCGDANARTHPAEMLERLLTQGWVETTCRVQSGPDGCAALVKDHAYVRLGPIMDLPDDARVKVEPDERTSRTPTHPAPQRVPVDLAVEVVIHTPCPAPPGSARCRVPDVLSYRYFLQAKPCGVYRVVMRYITGAI